MLISPKVLVLAAVVAVHAAIPNCSSVVRQVLNAPAHVGAFERRADIAYGSNLRHRLDVYVPTGAQARPVVIFWHGGAWVRGGKTEYRFIGAALANAGYVAVVPDYRLFPEARFPEFIHDAAEAVRWARDHATELGGDPNAIFLMGHSAGAHIAASLALDPRYLRAVGGGTHWLRGLIGLSGPYALEPNTRLLSIVFREPYSAADWQPIRLSGEGAPPTLLLQGTDDWMVKPAHAEKLKERLQALGVAVEYRLYEGRTHHDTVAAFSVPLRFRAPVLDDVRGFIDSIAAKGVSQTDSLQ